MKFIPFLNIFIKNPEQFNIDEERIAIAGDSAGGNMAIVTAMKAKNKNGPKLLYQCLFYPVTNAGMDTKSYEAFKDGPWLSKKQWNGSGMLMPPKKTKK